MIFTDSELADVRALMEQSFDTTATRQRAGTTTDRYGATVADWTSPTETSYACRLVPAVGVEIVDDGRDALITQPTARLPYDADVLGGDRLVINGDTYEVDGPPAAYSAHLDCRIKRVEG